MFMKRKEVCGLCIMRYSYKHAVC